jgi:hypothetical protein
MQTSLSLGACGGRRGAPDERARAGPRRPPAGHRRGPARGAAAAASVGPGRGCGGGGPRPPLARTLKVIMRCSSRLAASMEGSLSSAGAISRCSGLMNSSAAMRTDRIWSRSASSALCPNVLSYSFVIRYFSSACAHGRGAGGDRRRHLVVHAVCTPEHQPARQCSRRPARTSVAASSSSGVLLAHSGCRATSPSICVRKACTCCESLSGSGAFLRRSFMKLQVVGGSGVSGRCASCALASLIGQARRSARVDRPHEVLGLVPAHRLDEPVERRRVRGLREAVQELRHERKRFVGRGRGLRVCRAICYCSCSP